MSPFASFVILLSTGLPAMVFDKRAYRLEEMSKRFFRKQPVNAAGTQSLLNPIFIVDDADGGLKRVLRWYDLLTFGLASTLGVRPPSPFPSPFLYPLQAGIFVTAGVAEQQAGVGLLISFAVAGFAALLSGLCYSEYAARIPLSGSA